MRGYNDNPAFPYIDLEKEGLLVFTNFESLRDHCFLGAALARQYFLCSYIGNYDHVWKPPAEFIELRSAFFEAHGDPAHPDHEVAKQGMKIYAEYAKLKYPALYIGRSLTIRGTPNASYEHKGLAKATVNFPAAAHFPQLVQEIGRWNIFSEVGRIVFFSNEHNSFTPIHQDWGKQDEFVWIALSSDKKFFIFDEQKEEKRYLTGRAVTFNNADYHGSDPSPRAVISLRVDGVFKPEVRERLKLLTAP